MKTVTKYIFQFLLGSVLCPCLISCSDFLEEHSQDLAKVESWEDLDEVLLGDAYMQPGKYGDNEGNYDFLHFMTDEISNNLVSYADDGYGASYLDDLFPFYTWMADTGVDKLRNYTGSDAKYWNYLYKRINVCNMVLELIDEQPERKAGDADEKARVKGEAYFLRGAYYFLLANLYSKPYVPATADTDLGVPVKLTGVIEDVELSRNLLSDTYKQIISDLEDAVRYLNGKNRKSIYRANDVAANLLLSRVYLYMQNWNKAAEYAEAVLNDQNSLLDLHSKMAGEDCIYKDSPETIFSTGGYAVASAFADSESWGGYTPTTYVVSDYMCSLYKPNDLRKNLYVGTTEILGDPNAFMKVNGQRSKSNSYCSVSSIFLLRTPEAYFTYAEAKAFVGEEDKSREKLDEFLKTRMVDPDKVTLSGNDLIDFIREERAREFLIEGHRWFDLRRYTVCEPYPWSKEIIHEYPFFNYGNIDYIERYVLEKYDPAYTLPIPREIRNFQVSLGNNIRPDRQPYKYTPEDEWD